MYYLTNWLLISGFLAYTFSLQSQNPISPEGVFIADPSVHNAKSGTLYLYGSLDSTVNSYCSHQYHAMSTTNMVDWVLHKEIFGSSGMKDRVKYNNHILYAPDCIEKAGKYYLYYCQPSVHAEGVAIGSLPTDFSDGSAIALNQIEEIDPSVFIDDDQQAYYVWGQFSLKMAKLKNNMIAIDSNTISSAIITEKEHFFHEGAYMTKRNGIYYIIYAHEGRQNKPTCLGYSTATKPMGPYTYRGVIIDNAGCNPGNWNNHGSIASFANQWYVFYHRSTHGSSSMRKACVEPISFDKNGFIKEVEMTSQGSGTALKARDTIEARRVCLMDGNARVVLQENNQEILSSIKPKDRLAFKYIDFGQGIDSMFVKAKLPLKNGGFNVYLDKPWGKYLGYVHLEAQGLNKGWQIVSSKISKVKGVHALWFQFYGAEEEPPLVDMDSFWFK